MSKVKGGQVYVEIGADPRKLFKALGDLNKSIGKIGKNVASAGAKLTALGAGVAAPIVASAKAFATVGSNLYDMSQRTGVAAESLSVLKFAAEQSGTDLESLEGALKKMQKAIFGASTGSKEASEALGLVGLSARDLMGLPADKQMAKIADGLMAIEDPGARAAVAMKIFGKSGTSILPMLEGGSAGMARFADQAAKLGLVMDSETAAKADALGDAFDALTSAARMAFVEIGSAVAPVMTDVATSFSEVAAGVSKFIRENQKLANDVLKGAVAVMAIGGALMFVGKTLAIVSAGIAMVTSPIGIVVAALAGIAGAALYANGAFGEMASIASTTFSGVYESIVNGDLSGAMDILWAGLKAGWLKGIESIVVAWHKGVGEIKKAFVQLGSAWDKYVTKPVSMFGVRVAEAAQEREVLGAFDTTQGTIFDNESKKAARERRKVAEDLLASGTAESFAENKAAANRNIEGLQKVVDAAAAAGATDEERKAGEAAAKEIEAYRNAIAMVKARFAQLGIKTEEERAAAVKKAQDEIDQATQKNVDAERAGSGAAGAAVDLAQKTRGKRESRVRNDQFTKLMKDIEGATSMSALRGMYEEFDALSGSGRLTSAQTAALETALEDAQERVSKATSSMGGTSPGEKIRSGAGAAAGEAAQSSAEAVGTFSSMALGGLGIGSSLAQKQLDALNKIEQNTRVGDDGLVAA